MLGAVESNLLESLGTPITSWSRYHGYLIPVSNTVSAAARATLQRTSPYIAQPSPKQDSNDGQMCYTR